MRGPLIVLFFTIVLAVFCTHAGPAVEVKVVPVSLNYLGPACITVDPSGTPHIVYQDSSAHVRHAWRTGGAWADELVEEGIAATGGHALTVDSTGRLHLALFLPRELETGSSTWDLAHAVRDAGGWTRTDIEESWGNCAIAMGPDDLPRILFQRMGGALAFGRFDGSGWTVEDTGLQGGGWTLAVDAEGHASALVHRRGDVPYFATNASGSWGEIPRAFSPSWASMCLDSSGVNQFTGTYLTGLPDDRMVHFGWNGENWFSYFENVVEKDDPRAYRFASDLLCDGSDRLFAFYTDSYSGGPAWRSLGRMAFRDARGWRTLALGAGQVHSAALAPDGALHAVLVDEEKLRYVRIAFADLQPALEDLEVEPGDDGVAVGGTLLVTNRGSRRSAAARARFYLSEDDVLDQGDEPLARSIHVSSLRPGGAAGIPFRVRIHGPVAGKLLVAVVDTRGRRPDLDRGNDTAAVPLGE